MTPKHPVDLDIYRKRPRLLPIEMEVALRPGGRLRPILAAVAGNDRLRLDIRDRYFNVYYGGGNLLRVDGRSSKSPWTLHFDEKYFKGGPTQAPSLPTECAGLVAAEQWVGAFSTLMGAMEGWWLRHSRGERADCQEIARAASGFSGPPQGDYLVLDLEYQWAQRRFDMVAAKRRPTDKDPGGWAEPDLVFVEVKSNVGACSGNSGLGKHARDYRDIVGARGGQAGKEIKQEYQSVIEQKTRLGVLNESVGFRRFSPGVPQLLLVFVGLDPDDPRLHGPMSEVVHVADALLDDPTSISGIRVDRPGYVLMTSVPVSPRATIPIP